MLLHVSLVKSRMIML
uniref:Uncharacterized protein n=1 Tax=Anguilla anguilla TaxID=7936 RepID=A0A0E9TCY9_ANGAN